MKTKSKKRQQKSQDITIKSAVVYIDCGCGYLIGVETANKPYNTFYDGGGKRTYQWKYPPVSDRICVTKCPGCQKAISLEELRWHEKFAALQMIFFNLMAQRVKDALNPMEAEPDFATKREIVDLLDVQAILGVENEQKVIYINAVITDSIHQQGQYKLHQEQQKQLENIRRAAELESKKRNILEYIEKISTESQSIRLKGVKAVIYARAEGDSEPVDLQLAKCREYCRMHGVTVTSEVVDHNNGTPGVLLRELIKSKAVKAVVVASISPLVSDKFEWSYELIEKIQQAGIRLLISEKNND